MKEQYEIDNGVPIPKYSLYTKTSRFPLDKMEVGDSFVMPQEDRRRFTAHTTDRRKKGDTKVFSYRRISEQEVRVWRTK